MIDHMGLTKVQQNISKKWRDDHQLTRPTRPKQHKKLKQIKWMIQRTKKNKKMKRATTKKRIRKKSEMILYDSNVNGNAHCYKHFIIGIEYTFYHLPLY